MTEPSKTKTETEDQTDAGNGNQDTQTGTDPGKKDKVTFTPEQQAVVDAIIKDRLDQAKRQSEKAQKDQEEQIRLQALEDRKEWETLATERKTMLDNANARIAELEPLQVTIDRQNQVLSALVSGIIEGLPDAVKPLLTKLDPVAQLEYLTENRELLKKMQIDEIPETPNADSLAEGDKQKAQKDFAAVAKSWF